MSECVVVIQFMGQTLLDFYLEVIFLEIVVVNAFFSERSGDLSLKINIIYSDLLTI